MNDVVCMERDKQYQKQAMAEQVTKKERKSDLDSNALSREEKLLHAYFDGELTAVEERKARQQLTSDVRMNEDLEDLQSMRLAVRDWHRQQLSSPVVQALDVWKDIEREVKSHHQEGWFVKVFQRWSEMLSLSTRPAMAVACGVIIAVGISSVYQQQENAEFVSRVLSGVSSSPEEDFSQSGTHFRLASQEVGSGGVTVGTENNLRWGRRAHLSELNRLLLEGRMEQMLGASRIARESSVGASSAHESTFPRGVTVGDLRADGLDIDWVSSPQEVRIVPSQDRMGPPVIWVARKSSFGR